MRYRIKELPQLLKTDEGRRSLFLGQLSKAYPLLRVFARVYRKYRLKDTRIITVVGSLGKTTTAKACSAVLGIHRRDDVKNADYAVILNLLKIPRGTGYGLLEVGIDGPGQMAPHALMIRPDVVIVTSIAHEHVLSFRTLERIREEKVEMVRALPESGTVILNADDPHVMWMAGCTRARVITYGIDSDADVKAFGITSDFPHGTVLEVAVRDRTCKFGTTLPGRHMAYPVLAALALALAEDLDIPAACRALEQMAPAESRMQKVRLASGAWVIRDDFKSTRETIMAALDALEEIPAKRKILILGAASEITNDIRYSFHRELGKRIAETADLAFIFNRKEIFRSIRQGARSSGMEENNLTRIIGNPLSVIPILPPDLGEGDLILVKGRWDQRLARITLALAGKKVGCMVASCPEQSHFCDQCPWLATGPDRKKAVKLSRRQNKIGYIE